MSSVKQTRVPKTWIAHLLLLNLLLGVATAFAAQVPHGGLNKDAPKRPVNVTDIIRMTQLGEYRFQGGILGKDDVAKFSPDGMSFVILFKRGNLENNTNEYWIEYFRTQDVLRTRTGKIVAHFSSSSNRPAIQQLEWRDEHTLSFLGENPGECQQLYTFNILTGRLIKITSSKGSLTAYASDSNQKDFVFLAKKPYQSLPEGLSGSPIVVRTQPLIDLLTLHNVFGNEFFTELYIQPNNSHIADRINVDGEIVVGTPLYLSPDGRHLIIKTVVTGDAPDAWKKYQDVKLHDQLEAPHSKGEPQLIYQFQIVDLMSKQSHPLLNAPIPSGEYPDVLWSPDSKSVAISGLYLPLDSPDPMDEAIRESTKFAAEIAIEGGAITPITKEPLHLRSWDKTGIVATTGSWSGAGSLVEGHTRTYTKVASVWKQVDFSVNKPIEKRVLDVTLEEGMNSPPKIFVQKRGTGERRLLVDLNPQFAHLDFGNVRDLGVLESNGLSVKAGIYLPVGFQPGTLYPLVIQTHEWSPERFWIDGPFPSASAAQALAGKGFIVAQIAMNRTHEGSPSEVQGEAAGYERVIDYLNNQKMVDLHRMGIVGFSRTALGVKYLLLHSRYHFAAATIADGTDVGYFRYLSYVNSAPWQTADAEGVNGSVPVGTGLEMWVNGSLDFNLNAISTPIRLEAYQPESLLYAWETFGILHRLNKPIDFIYLTTGDHVLIKPLDRFASQQGNVDWFSFWLEGDKRPNPEDPDQYKRWEHLRELQDRASKATAQAQSNSGKAD